MQKYIYIYEYNGKPDYLMGLELEAFEFPIHPRGTTIDLVVVTPRQLQRGWDDDSARQYGIMYQLARAKGLVPCPHETALALRIAYTDQPTREYLTVATEDMRLAADQARVFSLGTDNKGASYITTNEGWPSSVAMNPDSKIVFVRPRK
jgi:hypothetical protein